MHILMILAVSILLVTSSWFRTLVFGAIMFFIGAVVGVESNKASMESQTSAAPAVSSQPDQGTKSNELLIKPCSSIKDQRCLNRNTL